MKKFKLYLGIFYQILKAKKIIFPPKYKPFLLYDSYIFSNNTEKFLERYINLDDINKLDLRFNEINIFILIKTFFTNSNYRKISKSLLTNIIKARLDETLEIIKKHIKLSELDPKFGNNIFITGGGSNLINIEQYYSKYFESEAINLVKKNKNKQNDLEQNFQACLGALKIIKDGWETEAIPAAPNRERKKKWFFSQNFWK